MARFPVFVLPPLVLLLSGGGEPAEPYVAYNSSDLSYLSNGIQFPAPAAEEAGSVPEGAADKGDLAQMEWLGALYDHHGWGRHLGVLPDEGCKREMAAYLEALENGTTWAAKSQLLGVCP